MDFFSNVGRKISQAGQDALQKTKDMADIAKINSSISEEEKRINNIYYQLGKLYTEVHSTDYEECFSSYILAVADSQKKISELRVKLQELREVTNCPTCGAEVPNSSSFCTSCGSEMPKTSKNSLIPPEGKIICGSCGAFIPKGMKFCTSCGALLQQSEAPVAPQQPAAPVAPQQPAAPVAPQQPAAPAAPQQPEAPAAPQQPAAPAAPQQPEAPAAPQQPAHVSIPATFKCPVCGADIDADSVFCAECGSRIRN